ncbi:hypothetical protein N473_18035 [Pseudoalteromonas luteoviolacea CPMOR-1]|uniref:Uncharacterized protein n=1 Tax=Pseudoalteromonas luteoviolacea CPMOR-1 TaxID=1365248 RepID=A0A161YMC1_9GAMM|nr:hypothetical protein [Pseudoalteromonas luteoviolacea]KZN62814.1 hypothetical protein N473_18035 [Pseudoalteromonas luteoviolacea CPMOR-1]
MDIFILSIAFLAPVIIAEFYSSREYELSFRDQFDKWRLGKYLALLFSFLYLLALMVLESANPDSVFSALYAGAWLSLIIYSKSFGELFLGNAEEFKRVGLLEDAAFIIGWVGLIHQCASYLLYV